ncbi:MAG: DNA polymerase III subunit gamma/tau [Sulfurovum sp.]
MSEALARKYRPSKFEDLIGQESVSQTLSLALDKERLSHAYLFSGLRGSGKTSTARIFAKALLCEKGTTSHPCDICGHCMMANEGRHLDIIEMDAASNRGIDDIKDLIEHTKYKPSSARFKIFIIDEVHMLTPQAFNALLKTLEEPPSFVKFILATTDPLKLPATILSRTQHFRFKKIPHNLVLTHLEHILNLEVVGYEKEALDIIARSGAGSLRDSLTLLDQAIVYSKNFVDVATITNMLGIIEPSLLEELIEDIINQDTAKILLFIKSARDYEAEMVLDELTLYLKEVLLSGKESISATTIERFFRVIAQSKELLHIGSDGEFVLSLALLKMKEAMEISDIDTMIRSLEGELKGVTISPVVAKVTAPKEELKKEEIPQQETSRTEVVVENEPEPPKPIVEPMLQIKEPPSPMAPIEKIDINEKKFNTLKEKIYERENRLGECFESNIKYIGFEDNSLSWESTVEGEDKTLLIQNWSAIKVLAQDVFGFETKIINISKKKTKPNIEQTASQPIINETPIPHQDSDVGSMIEDIEMKSSCIMPPSVEKDPSTLLQEPMVKEAIALLNPKKVRIKRNV